MLRIVGYLGILAAVSLLVLSLWTWQHAVPLAQRFSVVGEVGLWSARAAALGVAAMAQVLLLTAIAGCIYRRDLVSDALRLAALLVSALSGVAALALALAGR